MKTGQVYALIDVREPHHYRYVGQTVNQLKNRRRDHLCTAVHDEHLRVARWIRKVGRWNVRIVSIGVYPVEDLNFYECMWIDALREAGHRLNNVAPGGGGGFPRGHFKHTEETKAKMVATRRARSNRWGPPKGTGAGRKLSEETKRKMSEAHRRRWAKKRSETT